MKTYINLGCGERTHPDWLNVDLTAGKSDVLKYDLTTGVPFPSDRADAVYCAAVLEHFRRQNVAQFLKEIYRVLKPGGVIRVGVPDLEKLCQIYLEKLQAALAGDERAVPDYDWILLEMFDQAVRERSGGEMLAYLAQEKLPNESFVLARIGNEGRELIASIRRARMHHQPSLLRRLRSFTKTIRDQVAKVLAGRDGHRALEIGRFRLSGEAHHWMYDRFSLRRELERAGFREARICTPTESSIADWDRFQLDVDSQGRPHKPDLFFMEAIKPR